VIPRDKQNDPRRGVLRNVIEHHPTHMTEDELLRPHGVDPKGNFEEVDRWRIAVRELRTYGLLQPGVSQHPDEPITPSIAAIRFAELVEL
jgi:hypothetical protein